MADLERITGYSENKGSYIEVNGIPYHTIVQIPLVNIKEIEEIGDNMSCVKVYNRNGSERIATHSRIVGEAVEVRGGIKFPTLTTIPLIRVKKIEKGTSDRDFDTVFLYSI